MANGYTGTTLNNYELMVTQLITCPLCKSKYDQETLKPIILHRHGYCTICEKCLQRLSNGQSCPVCPKSFNIRWRVDIPQDSSASFEAIENPSSSVCPNCANEYDVTNKARCALTKICCTRCMQQNGREITGENYIVDNVGNNICPKCLKRYDSQNPAICELRYIICTQCVRFHICAKKFQTPNVVASSTCPLCIKVFSSLNPPKILHTCHIICRTCLISQCFTRRTKRMKRWFWCPICSRQPEKITIPLKFTETNLFIHHLQMLLTMHHIDFKTYRINSSPTTGPTTSLLQVSDPNPRKFESYLHCLVSGIHKIDSFLANIEKQMYLTVASGLTHDMNKLVQLKLKSLISLEHIAAEYVFTLYNLIHKDSAKSLGLQRSHYVMGIPEFPKSLYFISRSNGSSDARSSSGVIEIKSVDKPYIGQTCTVHIRVQNLSKIINFSICNSAEGVPLQISCVCTPHMDFLSSDIEHFQITFNPIKPGTHDLSINNALTMSKISLEVHDLTRGGSEACKNSRCANCKYMLPSNTFTSHMTNEAYKIDRHITCTSVNVVYLMQCRECGVQYVGETGDTIRQRMMQHRSVNPPSLAEEHFRLVHGLENLQIIGIEKVSDKFDKYMQEEYRIRCEAFWIKALHTHYPLGLNAIHSSQPRSPKKNRSSQNSPRQGTSGQQPQDVVLISDDSDSN